MNTSIPPFSWTANRSNTNCYSWVTGLCAWCDRPVLTAAWWNWRTANCFGLEWQECHSEQALLSAAFKLDAFRVLTSALLTTSVLALSRWATCTRSCLSHPFLRWSSVFPQPNLSSLLLCVHRLHPLPHHHYLSSSWNCPETFKQLNFSCFSLAGFA